jgi:hypothetical protein
MKLEALIFVAISAIIVDSFQSLVPQAAGFNRCPENQLW